jgi:DNA-binding transcriptional LysR family regulator
VLQDLRERRIGLAVVGRTDDAPDLVSTPVFRDVLRVFAAAGSPWSRRPSLRMEELRDETFVLREPGSATRDFMFGCLQAVGVVPRHTIQLGSNEAVKRAVAAGLGIGILSSQTLDVDVRSGDVVLLPCDDWECHRQFWIVRRADRMASRAEAAFTDLATGCSSPEE